MIRARLVREISPGVVQFVHYIGHLSRVPHGWIIAARKPARINS